MLFLHWPTPLTSNVQHFILQLLSTLQMLVLFYEGCKWQTHRELVRIGVWSCLLLLLYCLAPQYKVLLNKLETPAYLQRGTEIERVYTCLQIYETNIHIHVQYVMSFNIFSTICQKISAGPQCTSKSRNFSTFHPKYYIVCACVCMCVWVTVRMLVCVFVCLLCLFLSIS